jgi:hypothetical protein
VVSAAASTPLELPPEAEAAAPLAEDGAELPPPVDADVLDELDEQAATTVIAVPAASTPIAIRAARGRPVVLNRFMRPRILFIQVSNTPRPPEGLCGTAHTVVSAAMDVN